jgi:predicted RNA-binding protein with PIN domain
VVVPPPGLQRYLEFTKLSTAAVSAVARLIERDEEFRARVIAAVDEETVGRPAWLWLARPDGWEDELALLEKQSVEAAAAAAEERDERDARRRLAAARAAAQRATAAATAREQEAAEIRSELATERAHRRTLEDRLGRLEHELAAAQDQRTAAVRQLKEVEARLAERSAQVKRDKAQIRELERRRTELERASASAGVGAGEDGPRVGGEPSMSPGQGFDQGAAARTAEAAARGAAALAGALHDLGRLLDKEGGVGGNEASDRTGAAATGLARPSTSDRRAESYQGPPSERADGGEADRTVLSRMSQPLPGGIRDDSVAAVEHLLRLPGVVLLVDGYNVSMTGWPDLAVAEQRRRLVVGLGDAAARTGATAEVVFDGAAVEGLSVGRIAQQFVRVRFSPPGVEADDVLLDLVRQLPPARPVVVASTDQRVRAGAQAGGANLVHARQLLDFLQR